MTSLQAVASTRLYRMIADQIAARIKAGDQVGRQLLSPDYHRIPGLPHLPRASSEMVLLPENDHLCCLPRFACD